MENKYKLNSDENAIWLRNLRDELFQFGKRFPSPGGSSYYLGDDGTPWKDRPRETWITSRMAHVYSIGKILCGNDNREKEYAGLAYLALSGLNDELCDRTNGGWYAGVTTDGEILPTKQCYAHAFVILAATSGILAGIDGSEDLLTSALAIYDKYFWDEENGLSVDTWNTEFTELSEYRGINANMHSVEAFLAVYDAMGDIKYLKRAGRIIDHVVKWARDNNWRIPEHYKEDWTPDLDYNKEKPDDPFKPYGATPGHGIEWARLIVQWSSAMYMKEEPGFVTEMNGKPHNIEKNDNSSEYRKYIEISENLYNCAIKDGWNCDGKRGIVYTTDWNGKPIVHDRMHWTLAEAINTSAVLYKVTGDERYLYDYSQFMEYLDKVVHDKINGSWFHQLDHNNRVMDTVWPGKSDIYHALQSTLIPYNDRVGVSIAKAVKMV